MNCPRCNAEVGDSATFCPRCGSAVRNTAAFSYLPAGAPPWPTSTAQLPAHIATLSHNSTATAEQTSQFVIPESTATQKPARRSKMGILAIAGILLLTAIVGVGATLGTLYLNGDFSAQASNKPVQLATPNAAATAAATANTGSGATPAATGTTNSLPTPTSFQSISNTGSSNLKVSLKYPANWVEDAPQVTTDETSISFHPLQQLPILVGVTRVSSAISASITSPNDINQANFTSLQSAQGVSSFQIVNPVTAQRAIGGEQWAEQDATFNVASSSTTVQFHTTTIATKHNSIYYSILFYAPAQVYDEAMQKYFQPIFDSFKFQG